MNKEFADVINWLRTEDGEAWSRANCRGSQYYAPSECPNVAGFFSLKRDDLSGYSSALWWGRLPGDERFRLAGADEY